jgi:alginate O-acetyltransferase complex protein AlgI
MLFNSAEFLFLFLPLFIIIYFSIGSLGLFLLASTWVLLASLVFYGWDDPVRLTAIIVSPIAFNYIVGRTLLAHRNKLLLALGVGGNLLLLGYFKYAHFLVETFASLTGLPIPSPHVELPIGISFYSFTQIAFLVDASKGGKRIPPDPLRRI